MFVSSRSESSEFRRRYRWMRLFVGLTFLVLVVRLVQLQLVDGKEHHDEDGHDAKHQRLAALVPLEQPELLQQLLHLTGPLCKNGDMGMERDVGIKQCNSSVALLLSILNWSRAFQTSWTG